VISKAAFLLETAYFVNRCNRKDWPEWIKMNIGSYRPYGSFGSPKNLPNPLKRNKIFQLAASNMFLAWAEVLGNKLEAIIDSNETDRRIINPTRIDPLTGCESELNAEDYYDENLINPNGNNCPFALQNIVCILLLEITTFLRETYQYMPKKVSLTSTEINANLSAKLNKEAGSARNNSNNHNGHSFYNYESQASHSNDFSFDNELSNAKDQNRSSRIDYVIINLLVFFIFIKNNFILK
jgi:hypothetical protein